MSRAPALCRDRAAVVMVGDVGMPPRRAPFYEREISLLFARSYGPGRYEPSYEAWGVDYPAGQVRWTEGRNQEAVLDLLAAGRLQVSDLITQSFGIDRADEAFRLLEERTEPCLAIRLTYPAAAGPDEPVRLKPGPADRSRARSRLDRSRRLFYRDAAARLPGRRLRALRGRGHGQRCLRAAGRGTARIREGGLRCRTPSSTTRTSAWW